MQCQMEVDQVMESKTGHRISYRCYGDPEGKPIFYFHGWPGSRHEGQLFSDFAKENDCLLVAPERPGYGQSSALGHLSLRSWALLMGELSDHLGLPAFSVMGLSGGGPHACAVMSCLSSKVDRGALLVPMGPMDAKEGVLSMHPLQRLMAEITPVAPWFPKTLMAMVRPFLLRTPGLTLWAMRRFMLPECDQKALSIKELQPVLQKTMAESLIQGISGMYGDGLRFLEPWQHTLDAVSCPVKIWHGFADTIVPIEFGMYIANRIKDSEGEWLEQEGHFSVPMAHAQACFKFLAQ